MKKTSLLGLAGLLLMGLGGLSAHADMADMKAACGADVQKYCADVKPGGGRIAACLGDNQDKLSSGCQGAIASMKDKIKAGVKDWQAACGADMEKFCKDVKPGQGRRVVCLKQHESEVSSACQAEMAKMPEPGKGRSVNSPMGAPNNTPPGDSGDAK